MTDAPQASVSKRATLTVAECAAALKIGRNAAYEGIRSGQIPSVKIGKRILVPIHRLNALLGDDESSEIIVPALPANVEPVAPPAAVTDRAMPARIADDDGTFSPDRIRGASIEVSNTSAIYFLLNGREIVYVGQSTNVFARLGQHALEKAKLFDRMAYFPCAPHLLLALEAVYIKKFSPKLNMLGWRGNSVEQAIQTRIAKVS